MIHQYRLFIGRTCSFQLEHPEIANWLFQAGMSLREDPRCGGAYVAHHTEHRIHCGRNELARMAVDGNFDYLLFLDGDMDVDYRLLKDGIDAKYQPNSRPWARSFLESSLKFMMTERCGVIAAPAVTGPPHNLLNVFLHRDAGDTPITRMSHDEYRNIPPCIKQVYAIGTGVMLIDVNVLKKMPEPWFEDAWDSSNKQYGVRLSQDCHFCAKCNDLGFPVYANFYAPAGHIKYQRQDPPEPEVFGEQAA